MIRMVLLASALVVCAACSKKEEPSAPPPAPAETQAAAPPTPTVAAATEAVVDLETVPVEEEFEEEAEKELTPANLVTKLDAVEKELEN